ncbi:MAG TPA: hypothetical protein VF037_00735 [Gemmatimonadales bacterium]
MRSSREPPDGERIGGQPPHFERVTSAPGISFRVDAAGVVRTVMQGRISAAHLISHAQTREAMAVLGRPQIVDAREARLNLSAEDIRRFAGLVGELNRRTRFGRTAFVVSGDFGYGLARMFAAYDTTGPDRFAVFRTMEEAEAWIGGGGPR